jgi:hypothetical protein
MRLQLPPKASRGLVWELKQLGPLKTLGAYAFTAEAEEK